MRQRCGATGEPFAAFTQASALAPSRLRAAQLLAGMWANLAKGCIMRKSALIRAARHFGLVVALAVTITACQPIARLPALPPATAPTTAPLLPEPTAIPVRPLVLPTNGHTVQTDDIVTYYEVRGEGEPVILLPDAFGSTAGFRHLIPALAEEFRVYALDVRGRGRTTDSGKPLSYDLLASDTLAFMDALGIDKAHIVGHGQGAIIGLDMAIQYPERVKSLVSFGGQYDVSGSTKYALGAAEFWTIRDMRWWADMYRLFSPHPERAEIVFKKVMTLLLTQPNMTPEQLKAIRVPVLVLDGDRDEDVTIEHTREMAKLIPGAELKLMYGVGSDAPTQDAEAFNAIVLDYLREHRTTPAD